MKKASVLILLLFYFSAQSQTVIDSVSNLSFALKDTISDKLVALALDNSLFIKSNDKKVDADMYEWKRTRALWTNALTPSFNLNEFNIQPPDDQNFNNFYPRYNLNLSLPFGIFFSQPKATKRAKAEYEDTKIQREISKNQLKVNIKNSYQNYLTNKYMLTLQDALIQDEALLLSQVQAKFQNNQTSLENFLNSTRRYNNEMSRKLTLLRDVNNSKVILENYIGMPLEDAYKALNITAQ